MKKNKIQKELEYWNCIIGPIDKNKILFGGDSLLRMVVKQKFYDMFDEYAEVCSSGWGLNEEMKSRLSSISHLPIVDPSGKYLKEIDDILRIYYNNE